MAFIVIPTPGSVTGPCVPDCKHVDCAENRADAQRACHACGEPNGYGTRLVKWGPGLGHQSCLLLLAALKEMPCIICETPVTFPPKDLGIPGIKECPGCKIARAAVAKAEGAQ